MSFDPRENPLLNKQQPQSAAYYPLSGVPATAKPGEAAAPPPIAPAAAAVPVSEAVVPTGAPAQARDDGGTKASRPKKAANSGTLDTIEAIIIALILALTFRAFLVEAFVIPTGSMAPTLLGANFNVICPKCGYVFKETADVSYHYYDSFELHDSSGRTLMTDHQMLEYNELGELTDSQAVPAPRVRYCPNCGYEIPADKLPSNPVALPVSGEADPRYFPWANNGDRILVMKYLYDFISPQRWDVIVFKEPQAGEQNYIKRLIGRPGETLEIVDGDLYIADAGTNPNLRLIARKPKWVQDALWRLVYNNDYYPTDADILNSRSNGRDNWTWRSPWNGQGANAAQWQTNGQLITYNGAASGEMAFTGTPKGTPGMEYPYLTNMIGYNDVQDWDARDLKSGTIGSARMSRPFPGTTDVTTKDLHVETSWRSTSPGAASLQIVLGPPSNQYRFTWGKEPVLERRDYATGVFHDVGAKLLSNPGEPQAQIWYKVEMNNVDHEAQVLINGALVLEDAPAWTSEDAIALQNQISNKADDPEIRFIVSGAAQLTHLKLMHDNYYSQANQARARQGFPFTLGPDEFFAMGDNSPYSHDSRYWSSETPSLKNENIPMGVVPRRYLLGRAFFVYWPAGFRPMNGAVPKGLDFLDVPLVPNTGEMRIIR